MQRVTQQALDRVLLQVVDGSLVGVIFVVPLLMGGRHPLGQLVLACMAATLGLAWAGHLWCGGDARWRPTRAAPLLVAGAALVLLQTVPLPAAVLGWLAPHNAELLPLWHPTDQSGAGLGAWHYLSMTPADTRAGLAILLAYSLVFVVAVQRIRAVEDIERLLRWCALSAVGMAVFGLAQFFGGNGKFFWFYEHPYTTAWGGVKGSFTNRNHFAQFLALGVGPLIWWLQDSMRHAHVHVGGPKWSPLATEKRTTQGQFRDTGSRSPELKTYLLCLALGIVLFAGLLSLSRGGIIAMSLAVAIGTAVCYQAASLGNRFIAVLAGAGLLIGVSLAVFGYDRVAHRLESVSSGSVDEMDRGHGRRMIWAATLKSIPNQLLFGAGVGSFVEVYPIHADAGIRDGYEYTHAESGPLQVALETGLIGLALLLGGIAMCGWWCCRGLARSVPSRLRLCMGAIGASLTASVAHGMVDFVWYAPACVAVVAVLAACALRVRQLADGHAAAHERVRLPNFVPAVAGIVVVLLGGWMVVTLVGPAWAAPWWDRYHLALTAGEGKPQTAQPAGSRRPLSSNSLGAETEQKLIADLEHVVDWQPTHARAHLELADAHLRLFDELQATAANPMSLLNVRDAVSQSHFPTQEAMLEWLSRAVGAHWVHLDQALRHTRQALALCPLHGRGYLYLAELNFLDSGLRPTASAYVAQALRVRPFDGTVLYGAGSEAYLAGDPARWLEYARRAFHAAPRQQRQLMVDLIGRTTSETIPSVIDFIVREFQPDLVSLRLLHTLCAERYAPQQLTSLICYRAQQAEIEASRLGNCREAANVWLEAGWLHVQVQQDEEALRSARKAIQCDPDSYNVHYQLATCLLNRQLFAEAESHLRWCSQRKPGNQDVETGLREALKGRLDGERRAAAESERPIAR